MAPPPGGQPYPNSNMFIKTKNGGGGRGPGTSAGRLPPEYQTAGEGGAGGSAQRLPQQQPQQQGQRSYSPRGFSQSPVNNAPPGGLPHPLARQNSSGSPNPLPTSGGPGARRPSAPGPPPGPPTSRLANAPHKSVPAPTSPFVAPAPSPALKNKLASLPASLYALHKLQESIQADSEFFDLPLLPPDEKDELNRRVRDARGKARAAREREWDVQKENLVDVVVEVLSEFAGRRIDELVSKGELREAASPEAAAMNPLRAELQNALADRDQLVAKLSQLEVSTEDRVDKMQKDFEDRLEERIGEVEERWKTQIEKLRKEAAAAGRADGAASGAAPKTNGAEKGGTVSKADFDALAAKSKADFDALAARFDRLAALVGDATPSPPTTAATGSPPTSSSATSSTPAPASASTTVLGKRAFPADATEPDTNASSTPSNPLPPTLFARLAGVDGRVGKLETADGARAKVEVQREAVVMGVRRDVDALARASEEAEASGKRAEGRGKMDVEGEEEKVGKEEREKEREQVREAVEGLEKLEKRLGEIGVEWTGKLDGVDTRVTTLATDLTALKQSPSLSTPPPPSDATPTRLRTDLTALTTRVNTLSTSLSCLPTSTQLAILNSLSTYLVSSSSAPLSSDDALAQSLSTRLAAWDNALVDVATQGRVLEGLGPHDGLIAELKTALKAHKKKTDARFTTLKELVLYLQTSALPEIERVSIGWQKLQDHGYIPTDEALGVVPSDATDLGGAVAQASLASQQAAQPPPRVQQQQQPQPNGHAPRPAAQQQHQQPRQQQQQQQPHPPAPTHARSQATGGFADDGDEEDELDEDSMLVAPEEDDPMGGSGGFGVNGGAAGGAAAVNGFPAR
ncbi:hypothetical protein JCM6882_002304 [Rhodosporidiobolus microsporus]